MHFNFINTDKIENVEIWCYDTAITFNIFLTGRTHPIFYKFETEKSANDFLMKLSVLNFLSTKDRPTELKFDTTNPLHRYTTTTGNISRNSEPKITWF